MANIRLERCREDWDWYALHGGGNWASIEGTRVEWIAVANTLRGGEDARGFERVACIPAVDGYELHSPRNANSPHDYVRVAFAEAAALADDIARVVGSDTPSDEVGR